MTGEDVPHGDMRNFPWPSRPDVPVVSDASLAALLAGAESPASSAPEFRVVGEALAALTAGPASDELAGKTAALGAFRNQVGVPAPVPRPSRRRSPLLSRLPAAKAAAAAAALVVSLGGIATAAYAGALPAPLQRLAHDTIGAPGANGRSGTGPSPASPGAAGHAAYGLCTAWAQAKAHGTRKQRAVAFGHLAAAAGGAGNVAAYCATAPHPGTLPSDRVSPAPTPRGSGKPAAHPTPHSSGRPTAHPAPHGSGKPTSHPTPRGSDGPSTHPTGKPAKQA